MAGRFSLRRVAAPEPVPASEEVAPPPFVVPAAEAVEAMQEPAANPLLTEKLLDAKVRLHRRLIEEINLSALEKLAEEEIRGHVQQLVAQYVLAERLALNAQELGDFVSEILDEMRGLGPLRRPACARGFSPTSWPWASRFPALISILHRRCDRLCPLISTRSI
jgi:pilus assembly protein CpaF